MKTKKIIYAVSLASLVFLYFNDVFLFSKTLIERDLSVFFHPYIATWIKCLRNSELPLWNPYIMCGEPFLASVQPAFLYPLSFLYLLFPVDLAFNLIIACHFFLAGFFTFILMKELKASDEAAAISAVCFTFGGYLLSLHNLMSTLMSVAWVPVTIALFLKSLRKRSWQCCLLCSVCLYCMFTAGGLETLIMTTGLLLLISIFPFLHNKKVITLSTPGRLLYLIIILLPFLLIAAIQILPFIALVSHSIRSSGIAYREATIWSLAPKNLLHLFAPDIFWRGPQFYWTDQSWLKTIYTGFLPFILALFFILEKGPRKFLVLLIMAIGFLLSLGSHNPIYPVLYDWLPGLKKIRYPVKFFFVDIFFICLAAGWGWDYLHQNIEKKTIQRLIFILFSVFGFVLAVFFFLLSLYSEKMWLYCQMDSIFTSSKLNHELILHNIKRVMLFTILGTSTLFIISRKQKLRQYSFYIFILVLLADLFWGNYGHFNTIEKEFLHQPTKNQEIIKKDKNLFRIFTQLKIIKKIPMPYNNEEEHLRISKDIFCPNLLMEHGIFDVWGFSVLAIKNYSELLSRIQECPLPDSTNLLNFMNVKYVLWSEKLQRPGYKLIKEGPLFLYENTNCLPRAFLVRKHTVLTDEKKLREELLSSGFDPARTVFLKKKLEFFSYPPKEENNLKDSVKILEYKNNQIVYDVTSCCTQLLITSEIFYPGWHASINGTEVPVHKANSCFRAVLIPPGRHRVIMKYNPLSFRIGAYISITSMIVLLFLLICPYILKKIKISKFVFQKKQP